MPTPSPSSSLQDRILNLVQTLQFAWFAGHVLTLVGSALHFLSVVMFRSASKPYTIAYVGALISYGVVIYKTHGTPQLNTHYAQRLVMDENVQYLLLALYWFFSKPISVTLVPFATFSTFHALGYVRSNIIPTVFPVPPSTASSSSGSGPVTWQAKTQQRIKSWTDKNYDAAMRFVAQIEVVGIMGRLLLGVFRFQIMSIFLYAQFLRFRYHLSTYNRQAFTRLRVVLDNVSRDPRVPPVVVRAYMSAKDMIIRYGQAVVQQQPRQ
ncbi:hypothetical protein BDB00DRAFT_775144 [Zychaea mexicana]|uniref:uncharacterized protein n=1 Tax=Zychaea mexicana TaxID=64656 RepID=UPI0022FEB87B|nr:uncharacterized protein BDB00DRAFT_775144 [Zychaea mexicana]KAI9484337.1 hypothetical protein BDB00DRAFT_775144 [Zychaea mexicana]